MQTIIKPRGATSDCILILIYYILTTPYICVPVTVIILELIYTVLYVIYSAIVSILPDNTLLQFICCTIVWIVVYSASKTLEMVVKHFTVSLQKQEAITYYLTQYTPQDINGRANTEQYIK